MEIRDREVEMVVVRESAVRKVARKVRQMVGRTVINVRKVTENARKGNEKVEKLKRRERKIIVQDLIATGIIKEMDKENQRKRNVQDLNAKGIVIEMTKKKERKRKINVQ